MGLQDHARRSAGSRCSTSSYEGGTALVKQVLAGPARAARRRALLAGVQRRAQAGCPAALRAAGSQMTQAAGIAERHLRVGAPPGTGGGVAGGRQESSDHATTAASNRSQNADDRETHNNT